MDAVTDSGIQLFPVKDFDQISAIRAVRHEHLRGRNNVTSCRSPTRDFDTKLLKNELKKKRHLEFLRRRSVSPEPCVLRHANLSSSTNPSIKIFSMKHHTSVSTLHTKNNPRANGAPVILTTTCMTDGPSTSGWASMWSEQVTQMRQEKGHASASTHNSVNAQKMDSKAFMESEKIPQTFSMKTENVLQKKTLRESGVQTEAGLVCVKESDVQQLADCLQEALWREEAVKKKLAALQESTSNLMNSSRLIWTARCSEDLLRNKIKALEAQLQVFLQKFPKDGVKKLVLQMEKQKLVYEEKALGAVQKATQDKMEAVSKAVTLQEALITAKTEAVRWQSLYEELKISSGQLREKQVLTNEQLQQLHCEVELSRGAEATLREELASLRQEKKELQYNICLLEEDKQKLSDEMQHLRDDSQDFMIQGHLLSKEAEPQVTVTRDSQVEEQLRHTQEKLRLKERECEDLQTERHAMEQECLSSQARLSQCREELRQLSQRHKRPMSCCPWWKVWMVFLLVLAVVEVAMLWLWYPPFREQVEDLYADIESRIKDYTMEMASPRHSGCFRPI